MSIEKSLSNALGITSSKVLEKQEVFEPVKQNEEIQTTLDAEADYQLSRQTFRNLITQGNLVMEDMKELARQSESPRAYEVLATMMKTISETTKDLYDLQKKTKELKGSGKISTETPNNVTVERAVFVGSTTDLLKKIKEDK